MRQLGIGRQTNVNKATGRLGAEDHLIVKWRDGLTQETETLGMMAFALSVHETRELLRNRDGLAIRYALLRVIPDQIAQAMRRRAGLFFLD